jgi:hypothetical protein
VEQLKVLQRPAPTLDPTVMWTLARQSTSLAASEQPLVGNSEAASTAATHPASGHRRDV